MNRELILGPEAELEIAAARDWYDQRRHGLGADFVGAVDATLAAIQQDPFRIRLYGGNSAEQDCADSLTA